MITTAYHGIYLTLYSSGIHEIPRIKYRQRPPIYLFSMAIHSKQLNLDTPEQN